MKYLTEIKINKEFRKSTSTLEEIKSADGGFLKTILGNLENTSDGNGVFEKFTLEDFPEELYINTSLIETIKVL